MTLADSLNVTMCPKLQQNRPVQKRFFCRANQTCFASAQQEQFAQT